MHVYFQCILLFSSNKRDASIIKTIGLFLKLLAETHSLSYLRSMGVRTLMYCLYTPITSSDHDRKERALILTLLAQVLRRPKTKDYDGRTTQAFQVSSSNKNSHNNECRHAQCDQRERRRERWSCDGVNDISHSITSLLPR